MEVVELATFLPSTLYISRDNPLGFKISVPLKETPLSERTGFNAVVTASVPVFIEFIIHPPEATKIASVVVAVYFQVE